MRTALLLVLVLACLSPLARRSVRRAGRLAREATEWLSDGSLHALDAVGSGLGHGLRTAWEGTPFSHLAPAGRYAPDREALSSGCGRFAGAAP